MNTSLAHVQISATVIPLLSYVSPTTIALLLILLVILYIVLQVLRPKPKAEKAEVLEPIKLDFNTPQGPATLNKLSAQLEVYNVPVRLVAVILAPTGRQERITDQDELRDLLDAFIPGMMDVVRQHKPDFYRWPGQLSTRGFANSLFVQAALPGEKGKGTSWCALAGKFDAPQRACLIGMICCSNDNNGLDQIVVERPEQWLDIVRIKS